ncbi:MAG: DoxX family protein [Burkholderiales bacterium]|nr:DoxX family protein [Phycisphaerae bacterium]
MSQSVAQSPVVSFDRTPISMPASITAWVLQVVLALVFAAAGTAKLAGAEQMVVNFEQLGFGQWFRVLTGTLEVAGAVGLLIPRTTYYAALLLATVMAGAVFSHVLITGGSPLPALVLLALCGLVAFLRRP